MQSSNSFNKSLVFFVAAGAVLCVCISQSVFAAGPIIGWGSMVVDSGELDCNDFVVIAAGGGHCLALKRDGSIIGWGSNTTWDEEYIGQAVPPAGNDYVAIAAGAYHNLALKSDGSIVGWGWDAYG